MLTIAKSALTVVWVVILAAGCGVMGNLLGEAFGAGLTIRRVLYLSFAAFGLASEIVRRREQR